MKFYDERSVRIKDDISKIQSDNIVETGRTYLSISTKMARAETKIFLFRKILQTFMDQQIYHFLQFKEGMY